MNFFSTKYSLLYINNLLPRKICRIYHVFFLLENLSLERAKNQNFQRISVGLNFAFK